MTKDEQIIDATRCWIETVVIGYNFCPFAGRVLANNSIYFHVSHATDMESSLVELIEECKRLDESDSIETTLLIFPDHYSDFDDFLDLLDIGERLMSEQGYEGIYQLASFHPLYRFADSTDDDPANYTNRSPYPMLHLLRESSLEAALEKYERPEDIPQNNINKANAVGLAALQAQLLACYKKG